MFFILARMSPPYAFLPLLLLGPLIAGAKLAGADRRQFGFLVSGDESDVANCSAQLWRIESNTHILAARNLLKPGLNTVAQDGAAQHSPPRSPDLIF